MPLASFVMATHKRPRLLEAALLALGHQVNLGRWEVEVVVAHLPDPVEQRMVLEQVDRVVGQTGLAIRTVACAHPTGGAKRTAAFRASLGELVMSVDDDDLQGPRRAQAAIGAYEAGALLSDIKEWRYLELATGAVCRWEGRPTLLRANGAARVGTGRNYRRTVLQKLGAWDPIPSLMEKTLQKKLDRLYPQHQVVDLSQMLKHDTVCLQHEANIWDDRQFPPRGQTVRRGEFHLRGEGHAEQIDNFPPAALEHLRQAFGVLPWRRAA